ncbi:MAG: hypothetical protein PWQ09_340 [Candidatus Cloacimonadota bacterium]|jgi:DNA-binding MltR family transcriptional regulator|nr:hypothetical protein [Candidatus Cloacimonadota bacterium]
MKNWKPIKLEELSGDTQKVYDVLNTESDLACVLIGTSYLSELLANMIQESFIKSNISGKLLDPRGGSIGQFSTRADLAYCLGLIKKSIYQDLSKIAVIRNMFAHKHVSLDFNDNNVRDRCGELEAWRIMQDKDAEEIEEPSLKQIHDLTRNQFNLSVILIGTRIHLGVLSKINSQNKK